MFDIGLIVIGFVFLTLAVRRAQAAEDPDMFYDPSEGKRYAHKWGYEDTRFELDGPGSVRVTGDRYPISGRSMPYFLAFVEGVLGVPVREEDKVVEQPNYDVSEPNFNAGFWEAVQARFKDDQFSIDARERIIHSHGQLSVDEIYRVMSGASLDRVVDLVLYPGEEADIQATIDLANEHNVCLVPYGGGTNVSGALVIPTEEQRMVVSVDMRRMNRILWIDEENFLACVEAGISGKQLENELSEKGFTSGHDPDSIEFSTLGGWISTNASGMKKNRYGNIEDIVLEATLVTPTGEIETRVATPRNSTGIQPRAFLFGSEGNLGIITKAVMKIHTKPEVRKYGSLVFESFEKGVDFLKALRQTNILPASIRLLHNNEYHLGQALKPARSFWKAQEKKLLEFFLTKIKGFSLTKMVGCTLLMEGSQAEVRQQEKTVFGLAKKFGGLSGGASKGLDGYSLTFAIGYIRDFFTQFHVLGETFETSAPWNKIHPVCQAVKDTLKEQCEKYQIAGEPYLAYRVTQTYHTGVCIYFTMGFSGKGLEKPDQVYHTIEKCLRKVILDNGGSLSHHHGIGKLRQAFLPQIQTDNSIQVLRQSKKAIDPRNIFGIRNGAFNET